MKRQSRAGLKTAVRGHILAVDMVPPVEVPPDDGGGHGGYVCFACGRSTGHGEPFVCVSRLWKVSGGNESSRTMIDAVASLQVCIPCTILASDHRLDWNGRPRLLDSEIHGYYTFARLLADAVARRLSDTKVDAQLARQTSLVQELSAILSMDAVAVLGGMHQKGPVWLIEAGQCCECYEMIDSTLPNMEIEIAVNVPTPSAIELVSEFTVARYCNTCSASFQ